MNRLRDLQDVLSQNDFDALLLTSSVARLYATGFFSSAGMVLVTRTEGFMFTDDRYLDDARSKIAGFTVGGVSRKNDYTRVIGPLLEANGVRTLGYEKDTLTVGLYDDLREAWGPLNWVSAQKPLDLLRMVKSPWEIERMRAAQRVAETAFLGVLPQIEAGKTEKEICRSLIQHMYQAGADRLSFDPIVLSGPNTALPHGRAGDRALMRGDFLMLDFGVVVDDYCSDTTRMVAIGTADSQMLGVYSAVIRAQEAGIAKARAGATGADIHNAALEVVKDAGYGPRLLHSFGHGLGLKVHEQGGASPAETMPLPAGFVMSAEPGIYLPGRFGVRVEDVVVLREGGCENLTNLSKELIIA